MLKIPIIIGTNRQGNKSQHVARLVKEVSEDIKGVEAEVYSPMDFNILEGASDDYKKLVAESDGLILVVPEYNHSFPGILKLLLDSTQEEYNHKPVGLVGVSAGGLGGSRGLQSMLPVSRELGLVSISKDAFFSRSYKLITDDGSITGDVSSFTNQTKEMLEELIWMAEALKAKREQG